MDATGKPLLQQSFTNTLINTEVLLQAGDSAAIAKVMQRCVDDEGRVVGNYDENIADLFTKPLPSGEKQAKFICMILHHI